MNLIEKWKKKSKCQKISLILIFGIITYSFTFGIWFFTFSDSFLKSIESISIPSGYFNASLNPSQPHLEVAMSIKNYGFYDFTEIHIETSFDLRFFEGSNQNQTRFNVFKREDYIDVVHGYQYFETIILGENGDFNNTNLLYFQINVNVSKIIEYLLSVKIDGKYFYNIIPFQLNLYDINLYLL
ncbi:MAG: hypothetical protein ACFE75_04540 [Candidatus Hodarchaeota archaeon]